MPEPVTLLNITDSYLAGMARNQAVLTVLPFLKSLGTIRTRPGCGSCRSSNKIASNTYATAKRLIAGLPAEKKAALKRAINAHKVRINFRTDNGRIVELTF